MTTSLAIRTTGEDRAARRPLRPGRLIGYGLLLLVLFALLIWPLIMLAVGAFKTTSPLQPGGEFTLDAFPRMWEEINTSGALYNSVVFAIATTIFGVTLALLLAFISERTDSPFRQFITPLVVICATTSTVFYAIGYSLLANRSNGVVNVLYFNLTGTRTPLVDIESWPGLIFVDSLHTAAFLYLFLVGPFRALDRSHEEAALAAGASRLQTLLTINAQLLIPILSSVVLIGLVIGLKSFNIPLILGSHADLSFLTVRILRTLQLHNPPRYSDASALALVLTGVIIVLLIAQYWIIGKRNYITVTGKSYRQSRWRLGSWRWAAGGFVLLYAVFAVALPLGAIVFSSFLPFPGVYRTLTLSNYHALFSNPEFANVIRTTITAAGIGGFAGVALAFTIAYSTQRAHPAFAAILRGSTMLQLAMPGIVGSLALIWAVATLPYVRQIYGTLTLLMLAFIIGVLTISVQIASGAVRQVSRELEDAARISGASEIRVMVGITARLLFPSLLYAWFLAAIMILGDLDAPLMLSAAGTRTVSIHTYDLFEGAQESQAAAMLTLILGGILLVALVHAGLRWLLSRFPWRQARRLLSARVTGEAAPSTPTSPLHGAGQ